MRDSDTYMAILDEGEVKGRTREARTLLVRFGQKRLGVPDQSTVKEIDAIQDIEKLETLCERIHDVTTWTELLADNS